MCLPGNYRGIMLLEVAYKIVANVVHMRLQVVLESRDHVDHEPQCGFRTGRGTCDASFTIKQLVKKRREHGQETWILFLDLVKAFDRVPRDSQQKPPIEKEKAAEAASDVNIGMLWRVLLKYGVPPKLVRVLIAMHETVNVNFDVDGVTKSLLAIIGVKQGDLLGPELFDFYIAAIMETWRSTHEYELCMFRTAPDFKMTGRRSNAAGETFAVADSEYADDTGMPFCSRRAVEEQTPQVMQHFLDWGMEIHAGICDPLVSSGLLDPSALAPTKGSKSEVLFCSKPLHLYTDPLTYDGADLSPIMLPNNGFMQVVDEFPYLGDVIARNGGDARAVDARLESGCRAFGALRSCIFASSSVTIAAKCAVYEAIVVSITLYGCETWSLTEALLDRLSCGAGSALSGYVPCHTRTRLAAPHFDAGAGAAAGPGLHRHIHRASAAPLARPRESYGFRVPSASSYALVVGAASPSDRSTDHDVWPQHRQGAGKVSNRPGALARACCRSRGMA